MLILFPIHAREKRIIKVTTKCATGFELRTSCTILNVDSNQVTADESFSQTCVKMMFFIKLFIRRR